MSFKFWLTFNENVEDNFNNWLYTMIQYVKSHEKRVLNDIAAMYSLSYYKYKSIISTDPNSWSEEQKEVAQSVVDQTTKDIIKDVLKEKRLENYNWFAFSVGYLFAKLDYQREDLELAIDVTKRRIDSGDLTKSEIGQKGWLIVGSEARTHVDNYISSQQAASNRQIKRMKKSGETFNEDEKLIRLFLDENNIKIYYLPKGKSSEDMPARHMILCKYGKGTSWCTANPSGGYHSYYFMNDIYIVHKNNIPIYQFVDCKNPNNHQFMDSRDVSVKELEGDVYDILYKYLENNIKCYNISRGYSLDELLNLRDAPWFAYSSISLKNIAKLVSESTMDQAVIILNNLLEHRNKDWLSFRSFAGDRQSFSMSNDMQSVIRLFSEKLSPHKFIEILGEKTTGFVIKTILQSYQTQSQKEDEIYNFIKWLFNKKQDIVSKISFDEDLVYEILSSTPKEEIKEIIKLMGPDKINSININDDSASLWIAKLVKRHGFDFIFDLLKNKTNKIGSKFISQILSHFPEYAQYIESKKTIRLNKKNYRGARVLSKVIKRSKLPVKSIIRSREIDFINFLAEKDLSTGAVANLLKGDYLYANNYQSKLEKINEIAEIIGSERITKLKINELKEILISIISNSLVWEFDQEKLNNIKIDIKNKFIEIIKKYHKKLSEENIEELKSL